MSVCLSFAIMLQWRILPLPFSFLAKWMPVRLHVWIFQRENSIYILDRLHRDERVYAWDYRAIGYNAHIYLFIRIVSWLHNYMLTTHNLIVCRSGIYFVNIHIFFRVIAWQFRRGFIVLDCVRDAFYARMRRDA